MLFGYFKVLIIAVVLAGAMFVLLKKFPQKHKLIFALFSFLPTVFIIIRFIQRAATVDHMGYILQAVPFTLCGIASILIPVTVLTKSKITANFIYFISFPATVFAIALDNTITMSLLKLDYWCFVVPHTMYFVHIGLMLYFKYIKPEIKKLPLVLASFCVLITVMHGLNLLTAQLFPIEGEFTTNYIYTMYPGDRGGPPDYFIKEFPLLSQAWGIIDIPYLYLYLLIPVLAAVCGVLSLPLIKKSTYKKVFDVFKRKKDTSADIQETKESQPDNNAGKE